MKNPAPLLKLSAILILSYACNRSAPVIQDKASYIESIGQWQHDRLEGLKGKDGWLNLAGIYWLKEGKQSFGSHASNDIVFPEKAPAFIGTLTLEEQMVQLKVKEEADLYYKNERIHELELSYDPSAEPSYIMHGDFACYFNPGLKCYHQSEHCDTTLLSC